MDAFIAFRYIYGKIAVLHPIGVVFLLRSLIGPGIFDGICNRKDLFLQSVLFPAIGCFDDIQHTVRILDGDPTSRCIHTLHSIVPDKENAFLVSIQFSRFRLHLLPGYTALLGKHRQHVIHICLYPCMIRSGCIGHDGLTLSVPVCFVVIASAAPFGEGLPDAEGMLEHGYLHTVISCKISPSAGGKRNNHQAEQNCCHA